MERQQAEAEAKQQREIETVQSREESTSARIKEEERLKSEKARITTEEELHVAEENKLREVIVAQKNKESSSVTLRTLFTQKSELLKQSKASFGTIDPYVALLGEIRTVRGEVISAKDLRYIDQEQLSAFDQELAEAADVVSTSCVRFLNQEHTLNPYVDKVGEFEVKIEAIEKVVEAEELLATGDEIAKELDLLIETVSNLKITDATQTTKIIESISDIYASYNQTKGVLSKKRKALLSEEGKAEFNATLKLLEQSIVNYLDICDTAEQCEEYLTKLIVQIEELEGKFSEFDEFILIVVQKREEVYNAFEAKKLYLSEQQSKKSNQLFQAAERVLSAIKNKSGGLKEKDEINGYFASDMMVEKIRTIASSLVEMGETVKADDLISQLKTIKEDVLRQLKDRNELFSGGDHVISMGGYKFLTNSLDLDLSLVVKQKVPNFHLAGTDFFEPIEDESLRSLQDMWDHSLPSENGGIYRSEFLADELFLQLRESGVAMDGEINDVRKFSGAPEKEQLTFVQKAMAARYQEGYVKGIHEYDAHAILCRLIDLSQTAGVLQYAPQARALAKFFWNSCISMEEKQLYLDQIKAASLVMSVFPNSSAFAGIVEDLTKALEAHQAHYYDHEQPLAEVAKYLFDEWSSQDDFTISQLAASLYHSFSKDLKLKKAERKFKESVGKLTSPKLAVRMIRKWLLAFIEWHENVHQWKTYVDEVSLHFYYNDFLETKVNQARVSASIEHMKGDHATIVDGVYELNLIDFLKKLGKYTSVDRLRFDELKKLKKSLTKAYKEELRLAEFKPRVLSSFVRNKLIDKVYFPLIGANLAKQIGEAGENKRTDLMGLLLLVSPPGYGKTTLMEYIASR